MPFKAGGAVIIAQYWYTTCRLYAASPWHDANPRQAAGLGSQGGFAATHGRGFRRGYVRTTINIEIHGETYHVWWSIVYFCVIFVVIFSLKVQRQRAGTATTYPTSLTWSSWTLTLLDRSLPFVGALAPPISETLPPMVDLRLCIDGKVLSSSYRFLFLTYYGLYTERCPLEAFYWHITAHCNE